MKEEKAKVPVGESLQGEVKLTDKELVSLFKKCVMGSASTCCGCFYRKARGGCDLKQLYKDLFALLNRLMREREQKEEETAKKRFLQIATLPQEEVDALFNAGRFNDIAVGYAKLAMRTMSQPAETVAHLGKAMMALFDSFDAKAARTAYFKD